MLRFTLCRAVYDVGAFHIVQKQCMMLVHFSLYKAVDDVGAFCIVQSHV